MRTKLLFASLLIAGCWKTGTTTKPQPTPKNDVRVDVSSINLGDDCGDELDASAKPSAGAPASAELADMPPGGFGRSIACIPTTMQLQVMNLGSASTAVRVKRVELLDASGKVLDEMTARKPTHWDGKNSTYVPWDQVAKGGESVQASYPIIGLDWNKVPGGRWEAHTKTFTVRVTVAVGDSEQTVEKKATAPAMIEPDVVT